MSDRVAIFDHGIVQQVGTPLDLYNRPANKFVAGFLGSPPMNFLEAEIAEGQVRGDGFAFAMPTWAGALGRGTPVTLGMRPEDVTLRQETGPAASISLVEPMGSSTIVYTRIGPNLVAIETGKDTSLGVGATVSLAIEPNRLHLFDAVTGDSLAPEG